MLIYGFFKAVELLSFHNMTTILIIPQLPSCLQCVCNEIVFCIWLMHWKYRLILFALGQFPTNRAAMEDVQC